LTVVLTLVTFVMFPQLFANFRIQVWGYVFPILAVAGLLGMKWTIGREDASAFGCSCAYIVGMLTSVVFSVYPSVLPASTNPAFGLTIANAKAGEYGLKIGLIWWVIGMALASGYTVFVYRSFAGKVRSADSEEHESY